MRGRFRTGACAAPCIACGYRQHRVPATTALLHLHLPWWRHAARYPPAPTPCPPTRPHCLPTAGSTALAARRRCRLPTQVGRKIHLQKDRRAVVLCVVDMWDFDGSLPRAALR